MRLNDAFRHGKTSEAQVVLAENTREARVVAHNLLSGGSANLLPEAPARSLEAAPMIERDAIDMAPRSLQQDELRIRAAAAARWAFGILAFQQPRLVQLPAQRVLGNPAQRAPLIAAHLLPVRLSSL
jgi:hypothetical protein